MNDTYSNINTEEHIKYIEKQKRDAELADIKKKEEEENIRLRKKDKQIRDFILHFENKLDEHYKNIDDYKKR